MCSLLKKDRSSSELNSAALRLVLDILPGLEGTVLMETEGLVTKLYNWVSEQDREDQKNEPLRSYATGLLAAAMEVQEVATDPDNRSEKGLIFILNPGL